MDEEKGAEQPREDTLEEVPQTLPTLADPTESSPSQNRGNSKRGAGKLHPIHHLTFWLQVGMGLIGLAALWIYHGQLTAMQGQLAEMRRSGEQSTQQMWQAIEGIRWMAQSADWAQKDTHRSVANGERQSREELTATIENFHREQRAWLWAGTATGAPKEDPPWKVQFPLSNSGKTPAENVVVYFNGAFTPRNIPPRVFTFWGEPMHEAPIAPGPDFTFSYDAPPGTHFDPIILKNQTHYAYGAVTYDDVFGESHWLTFCFLNNEEDNYAYCTEHNEMGDGPLPPEFLK